LKNVLSKIHNEKLHYLQDQNVQTSKTWFFMLSPTSLYLFTMITLQVIL
jgi:hypothetical protein